MKITRKEEKPEPIFTEKELTEQYAEVLAFRGVKEYRKNAPQLDANKFYVFYYRVMKKDGKETRIWSNSSANIQEATANYQRELPATYKDCYYIKILCARKDLESFIRCETACVVTVLESEAIER